MLRFMLPDDTDFKSHYLKRPSVAERSKKIMADTKDRMKKIEWNKRSKNMTLKEVCDGLHFSLQEREWLFLIINTVDKFTLPDAARIFNRYGFDPENPVYPEKDVAKLIGNLISVCMKWARLRGMIDGINWMEHTECLEKDVYWLRKNVDFEFTEFLNPVDNIQKNGLIIYKYLKGKQEVVDRLIAKSDNLKDELHKIADEVERAWGSLRDDRIDNLLESTPPWPLSSS